MRKFVIVGAVVLGLFLAAAAALMVFFNAESQRGTLSARLEASLGRKVKLGRIRLGLFPPSLQVSDTEIAEALGFKGAAFSTAKELRVRVRLIPLLSGRLEAPAVVLDEPIVNLVRNERGEWNFASLGSSGTAEAKQARGGLAPSSTPLEVDEMRVVNGKLTVTDLKEGGRPVTFDKIDLRITNFSRDRPFDWEVSFHPPGGEQARIEANGTGGPLNPENLAGTPAKGTVKFSKVDLAMLNLFTGEPGLGGSYDGDAEWSSDAKGAQVKGNYKVDGLRLSPKAGTAQAPVTGNFFLTYAQESAPARRPAGPAAETPGVMNVKFQLASGRASAHTGGRMRFARATSLDLVTSIKGAPLADVAKVLPALGIAMPAGSSLNEGTLNGEVKMAGTMPQAQRTGWVQIDNGRLSNYNVAGKLGSVVRLMGVDTGGKDTVIEHFKASFSGRGTHTDISDLLLRIPGMDIAGRGGFDDGGPLDFRGIATLTRAGNTVGGLLQRVTGSSNTVPFRVVGTLENPSFQPDVGGILSQHAAGKGEQQQAEDPGGKLLKGLSGLFGKKK